MTEHLLNAFPTSLLPPRVVSNFICSSMSGRDGIQRGEVS